MVLTIHVVRQGGHGYYVDDLVPGIAEGGRVTGEEPGVWTGSGARSLGLGGAVEPAHFAEVLRGRHPFSTAELRRSRGERSSAGFDLTFCAPKSVSLLHLLAPQEMGAAAAAGHHAAVDDALEYLGREGVGARRTRHGEVSFIATTGPVAGRFVHRTSRSLDPHLHTHVVVANVVQGVDGVWSGLDSRRLHAHLGAAQALYHARLRLELAHRMGAAWELRPSGTGEVVGVENSLRRLFSTRSASMDEYGHRRSGPSRGRTPTAAAFHADRPEKDRTVTVEGLADGWRRRASDLGFDLGDLTRVVGRRPVDSDLALDGDRLRRRLVEMGRGRRWLGPNHLVAAVAASTPAGGSGRDLVTAARRLGDACDERGWPVGQSRTVGASGRWDPAALVGAVEGGRFRLSLPGQEGRDLLTGHRDRSDADLSNGRRPVPARSLRDQEPGRRRDGIGW